MPGELREWLTSHKAEHDRTEIAKTARLCVFGNVQLKHLQPCSSTGGLQPEENLFLQDLGGMVFSKETVLKLCKQLLISRAAKLIQLVAPRAFIVFS